MTAPPPTTASSGAAEAHRQTRYKSPPGATDVILVRHGASAAFVPGTPFPLKDGHGDPPLATDGHIQAIQVATRLASEPIKAIYATSLVRTQQTAQPLAEKLGLEIKIEPELREIFLGEWEGGLFRAKAAARDPAYLRAVTEGEWGHIPGAETSAELLARCRDAINRLHEKHKDELVVVVVHGGVIGALLAHATGAKNAWAFTGADNGSCHHIVVKSPTEWTLRCYNDTSHLDGGFTGEA